MQREVGKKTAVQNDSGLCCSLSAVLIIHHGGGGRRHLPEPPSLFLIPPWINPIRRGATDTED